MWAPCTLHLPCMSTLNVFYGFLLPILIFFFSVAVPSVSCAGMA